MVMATKTCAFLQENKPTISSFSRFSTHIVQTNNGLLEEEEEEEKKISKKQSLECYVAILHSYITTKSLQQGKMFHTHLISHSLEHHSLLNHLLIQMYASCGAMDFALFLLTNSPDPKRSIYSLNTIMKELFRYGKKEEALKMCFKIIGKNENMKPNKATFIALLSGFTRKCDLEEGKIVHLWLVEDGIDVSKEGHDLDNDGHDVDAVVSTALVTMYGKCGDLESAFNVSESMMVRDSVGWNALFAVNAHHGKWADILRFFKQMILEGVVPNRVTFVSILSACEKLVTDGRQIHAYIVSSRCGSDTIVGTSLLNMYGKCGKKDDAMRVFDDLTIKDVVAWNAIVAVFARCGFHVNALQLFEQMVQEAVLADKVTFICILDASVEHLSLREVEKIHVFAISHGFVLDVVVGTSLINMYGKCGSFKDAQGVFDTFLARDPIAWNAMLSAQVQSGEGAQTYQFFTRMLLECVLPCRATFASSLSAFVIQEMLGEGKMLHTHVIGSKFKADIVLGNTLVNMYGKCGYFNEAETIFKELPEGDVVSWNALIAAYAQQKHEDKAWGLMEQMQVEGILPDKVTFVSILDACVTDASLAKGKLMHCCIISNHFDMDTFIGSALVSMYGKCGSLCDAEEAFNHMPRQTTVSWNAFLATFSQHGKAKQTIRYFDRMKQEVVPDKVTFIILLTACSHAGLVDEACDFFSSMLQTYNLIPSIDHYACMIDLLGRAGRLQEAENLLKRAPCRHNAVLYKTLLGACMQQSDVERGENAAEAAFHLDRHDPTPYIMLRNLYSVAERGSDIAML